MVVAGKVILALVTLAFLSSIGGAMAVAMPLLMPLLWAAARSAQRFEYGFWVLLGFLSLWEAVYIYAALLDPPGWVVVAILLGGAGTSVVFVATSALSSRREGDTDQLGVTLHPH